MPGFDDLYVLKNNDDTLVLLLIKMSCKTFAREKAS